MESAKARPCVLGAGFAFLIAGRISVLSSACCEPSKVKIITGRYLSCRAAIRPCADGISDVFNLIHETRSESESDGNSAPYEKVQRLGCAQLTRLAAAGPRMQQHSAQVTDRRGEPPRNPALR